MIAAVGAGTAVSAAAGAALGVGALKKKSKVLKVMAGICGAGAVGLGALTGWSVMAYKEFDYNGDRKLAKDIVEGTAAYVKIPDGGVGLDVGCGSGALTIACARVNPNARMVGCDRWGKDYASFSRDLCIRNAKAEGVENVSFRNGNALSLPFADEAFDAVTSNYVYHNITGSDRQALIMETLRVLKKGGCFAIHDLMSPAYYGNTAKFAQKLRDMGFQEVRLVDTTTGLFMDKKEATKMMLNGSKLLVGIK